MLKSTLIKIYDFKIANAKAINLVLSILILSSTIILLFLSALGHTINIPTWHIDGTYQTASALYRLDAGEIPGDDFLPYLGVGLVYVVYPLFSILGGDISASLLATHFLSSLSIVLCFFITAVFLLRGSNKILLASYASLFFTTMIVYWQINYNGWFDLLYERWVPGASLRSLRAALPFVVLPLLYLVSIRQPLSAKHYVFMGIISGVCLIWSNDFGIPTYLCCLLFMTYLSVMNGNKTNAIKHMGIAIVASLFVGYCLYELATLGNAKEMLLYNWRDIRHDQYWYFGSWSEINRIFTFSDFFTKIVPLFGWHLVLLLVLFAAAVVTKSRGLALLVCIALSLLGGGILASVGGHIGKYEDSYNLWAQLTYILIFVHLINTFVIQRYQVFRHPALSLCLITLVLPTSGYFMLHVYDEYKVNLANAAKDSRRFYVEELGGFLPVSWEKHVSSARSLKNIPVREEYWGIWSAVTRNKTVSKVDSVIHALGEQKQNYFFFEEGQYPELVMTTSRNAGRSYQTWSMSANYWFYEHLISHYVPIDVNDMLVVWKKTDERPKDNAACSVSEDRQRFTIATPYPAYFEVELGISAEINSSRSLIMVNNGINVSFDANRYLSLNPNQETHKFIVAAGPQEPGGFEFDIKLIPAETGNVTINQCRAKALGATNNNLFEHLNKKAHVVPLNVNNDDWQGGVHSTGKSFLLPSSYINRRLFKPGTSIRFGNGETRTIGSVDEAFWEIMTVHLEGEAIDIKGAGYPKRLAILPKN